MSSVNQIEYQALDFAALNIGDELPTLEFGTVTRHILALYCGGSGDHNPIHVDQDFAKSAGYDDVFAHEMVSVSLIHISEPTRPY